MVEICASIIIKIVCCICEGDNNHMYKRKESTSDIQQFLQYVEKKFSDVLIPANQLVTQEYILVKVYMFIIYNNYCT